MSITITATTTRSHPLSRSHTRIPYVCDTYGPVLCLGDQLTPRARCAGKKPVAESPEERYFSTSEATWLGKH